MSDKLPKVSIAVVGVVIAQIGGLFGGRHSKLVQYRTLKRL